MSEQDWKDAYRQQLVKRKQTAAKTPATKPDFDQDFDEPTTTKPDRESEATATVRTFRKIIVALWLGITGIQIVIWLLIGLLGKHFPDPWWLWTGVAGGVLVGIIWYISAEIQNHKSKRGQ